jgi:hypothetical protein
MTRFRIKNELQCVYITITIVIYIVIQVKRGCQVRSAHARILFTFLFQTIDHLIKIPICGPPSELITHSEYITKEKLNY